jgi:hypothetical protein
LEHWQDVGSKFKQRERVVIIAPAGTCYLSPLLQFSEARDLHVQQAELATMAFLERNPKGFANPDLLKLMFLKPALAKGQGRKTFPESRDAQIHGLGVADGRKRNAFVKGHQPAMMPGCQRQ